jgi:hypothetical protein
MERCPVCRARVGAERECPRCTADLSALRRIEAERRMLEAEAVSRLCSGSLEGARRALEQARGLQRTPLNQVLGEFVRFLLAGRT